MPEYPRKIRARTIRGEWVFEEMVPSAGGSYYVRRRVVTDEVDLVKAIESDQWLPGLLAPASPVVGTPEN